MLQRNNTRAGIERNYAEVQDSQANDMDEDREFNGSLGIAHSMPVHDKDVASNVGARRQTTWSVNSMNAEWAVAGHRYLFSIINFWLSNHFFYKMMAFRNSRISLSQGAVPVGGAKRTRASESLSQPDPACYSHSPPKQAKFGHQRAPSHIEQESGSQRLSVLTAEVTNPCIFGLDRDSKAT
jgi:hypothetical protein